MKSPNINISVYCIQNTEKFSIKKSFLHKGGYFCIIRQILTRKRAKSLILHIMKSYEHIMKLHETPYNMHYIVYKIEYLTLYTPYYIHQWGVIYANTHTIYYILTLHLYKISTNIVKIYHFSCNFCTFLYQN